MMSVKYIRYDNSNVYALYYRANKTLYYNLSFKSKTKVYYIL